MKKLLKFLFSRIVIVSLLILFQFVLLLLFAIQFTEYFVFYYLLSLILAFCLSLVIVNRKDTAEYKIAWLVTVLLIPIFGTAVYLIFSGNRLTEHTKVKMSGITGSMQNTLPPNDGILEKIVQDESAAGFQSRYIVRASSCPPYENTDVRYFPLGEDMFAAMVEELERAEKYIFLEYFIISEGRMWNTILEILTRKAASGVDVRLIYDDMGCITYLPGNFPKEMVKRGIRCHVFNRFIPVLSARLNNRNHRKIGVIDGKVAFTGGINLADEYINEHERFGHWKDNAVLLRGEAAWSMTVMFLTMWEYLDHSGTVAQSYEHYRPTEPYIPADPRGFVQPYTDNPVDNEPVGKTIYLNMINRAEKYVYITTPYLIIDEVLETALCSAAKSGVDVRIIVPRIGDKFFIHETTKSYYPNLIKNGVKLYEYTPGFIHAKTFVCDGKYATVGTVNLDFRSLYLHFECGVWMYGVPEIDRIREDYIATMEISRPIGMDDYRGGFWRELFRAVMRLLSPMM